MKAIEFGVGGKLQNIVVDTPQTSKVLLQRNCFNHAVNLIPNDKIQWREVPHNVIREAANIAHQCNGEAIPAYDAIEFDQEVKSSIMYAFGNFVITTFPNI